MIARCSRIKKKITVRRSVEDALSILGDTSKAALLYHLKDKYDILLDDCGMDEVEAVLKEILGEGSSIITAIIDKRYRT